jgi:translation initiation factor 1 (eIF-1/SUI1)
MSGSDWSDTEDIGNLDNTLPPTGEAMLTTYDDEFVNVHVMQEKGKWKTHIRGLHNHLTIFRVKDMKELLSLLKKSVCKTGGCLRFPEEEDAEEDAPPFIVLQGDHGIVVRDYILKKDIKGVRLIGGR